MRAATATEWIYDFDEGLRDVRGLLGGKGSGIAEYGDPTMCCPEWLVAVGQDAGHRTAVGARTRARP